MVYKVIGIMSGSSLDGLDIVYTELEENRGAWKFEILAAECVEYTAELTQDLLRTAQMDSMDFLKLHTRYGRFIGEKINRFIDKFQLHHKVHFIASHGHTVFHDPENYTSFQLGDGASIAAVTGLPVVSDLRSLDVALGGQGAPIVPIGDKLLFGDYDYWLNIGGIANVTVRNAGALLAFDVCPANQMLNVLAQQAGKKMDDNGNLARKGTLLIDVLAQLNEQEYFAAKPPKSLSNEMVRALAFPFLLESPHATESLLRTAVEHIAEQVAAAVRAYPHGKEEAKMLITGGGAFNGFLVEQIREAVDGMKIAAVVPDAEIIKYKEALVMALIGALRWREETNVMKCVTGAERDSISGALWMGHSYNVE